MLAVRTVAGRILDTPRWLNADPEEELRMEARIRAAGLAVILLQRDPEHRLRWCPVASWGRTLDTLELEESRIVLELKALREGAWKLSEFTSFARNLTMKISPELKALLKIANKANPTLQAMLIDLTAYKPTFLVRDKPEAPPKLGIEAKAQDPDSIDAMKTAEDALRRPIYLPPKARFSPGPHIHVQFDGGA